MASLAVAAGLSAAGLLALGGAPAWAALAAVALVASIAGLRSMGWLGGMRRLVNVAWLADGTWLLTDARQRTMRGVICSDTRVGKGWVWLRWNTSGRFDAPPMWLARGDVSDEDLRRLKVRLRIEGVRSATMRDQRRKPHAFCANFLRRRQSTDAVRGGPSAASCRQPRRPGSVAR